MTGPSTGEAFPFDEPLKLALAGDRVPDLPAGFADRIIAATEGRAEPLPPVRSAPAQRWRSGRRLVFGIVAAGALGTAAAATGVLEGLGVELPTPQEMWSSITGEEPAPAPPSADTAPVSLTPVQQSVVIEGPIDTPEELEEAFRRIDQLRGVRRDTRRSAVDRWIENRIERRRERGITVTPEQEERIRGRVENYRNRSDERFAGRLEERRDALREDVENGAELTRQELIQRQLGVGGNSETDTPLADRLERLRELPPEERRARIRQWRERRQDRIRARREGNAVAPAPNPDAQIGSGIQTAPTGQPNTGQTNGANPPPGDITFGETGPASFGTATSRSGQGFRLLTDRNNAARSDAAPAVAPALNVSNPDAARPDATSANPAISNTPARTVTPGVPRPVPRTNDLSGHLPRIPTPR